MKIAVIDYGAGNVKSVLNALHSFLAPTQILLTNQAKELAQASHILLPGVGAFADCMNGLNSNKGLVAELQNQVLIKKKPFLGICVGMQVLASRGFENGEHEGLNFIAGEVRKIAAPNLKVPQKGWNEIIIDQTNPILADIGNGQHFYFANSYRFIYQQPRNLLAHSQYGEEIAAVIAKENIFGAQFHPEKSGIAGLKFLQNFSQL